VCVVVVGCTRAAVSDILGRSEDGTIRLWQTEAMGGAAPK
jgi:hypothetical protein